MASKTERTMVERMYDDIDTKESTIHTLQSIASETITSEDDIETIVSMIDRTDYINAFPGSGFVKGTIRTPLSAHVLIKTVPMMNGHSIKVYQSEFENLDPDDVLTFFMPKGEAPAIQFHRTWEETRESNSQFYARVHQTIQDFLHEKITILTNEIHVLETTVNMLNRYSSGVVND